MTTAPFDSASPAFGTSLRRSLAGNWWVFLVRGLAAIAFGVLAFAWPGLTILTLAYLWGAFAVADGVLALWAALAGKGASPAERWWLGLVGLLGVFAGMVAFGWPVAAAWSLVIVIGVWAAAVGLLQIWGAIRLRKAVAGEWMLALSGVLLVLFGVSLLLQPAAGALTLVWLIAAFSIVAGVAYLGLALRLRKMKDGA